MNRILVLHCLLLAGLFFVVGAVENSTHSAPADQPNGKSKIDDLPLRRPGFLFLELRVSDIDLYRTFFHNVAGYKVVRDERGFMILNTECGEILLSGPEKKPAEVKVTRKLGGGVEVGIVVGDLDAAFAAAKKHPLWTMEGKIEKRPWGVRDFRVYAPDGFYVRVTE